MKRKVEVVEAKTFYGRPTPGHCILVEGRIHLHLYGEDSKEKAEETARTSLSVWKTLGLIENE